MLEQLLFWGHMAVIIGALAVSFFVPFLIVFVLVVGHRLHLVLFRGCAFSRLQEYLGVLPRNMSFIQVVGRRLFRVRLTARQSDVVDYALVMLALGIALVREIPFV